MDIFRLFESIPKIPNLPTIKKKEDLFKLKVIYPLIHGFAYAYIFWDPHSEELRYYVIEPPLNEKEKEILEIVKDRLYDLVDIEVVNLDRKDAEKYIVEKINQILKELNYHPKKSEYLKLVYYIIRDTIGLGKIEPLMHDPFIEDISCDGVGIPIFVYHSKYGSLKTNIIFNSNEELEKFVIKLAQKAGRYISYAEPYLDGILPDGSRVNATYTSDITTRGPTFTIRKFRKEPWTPVDLILNGTMNVDIAAYLWWAVEHKANILIGGETGAGKTTLLNAIAMFIPKEAKVISIEDTREIQLYHENWIPTVTREGFGPPDETGKRYGEVTMFDLLKESFRQRPDYVIVGEVRGKEAYVLFQGMASGHACMGTIHADSVTSVVRRLTTPPINLPIELIEHLDLFIFIVHAKEISPSARRIKEVTEVTKVNYKYSTVETNKAFVWDPENDTFVESEIKELFKKLARKRGFVLRDVREDIKERKEVLQWMVRNKIRDYREFTRIVNEFYVDKEKVLEKIYESS